MVFSCARRCRRLHLGRSSHGHYAGRAGPPRLPWVGCCHHPAYAADFGNHRHLIDLRFGPAWHLCDLCADCCFWAGPSVPRCNTLGSGHWAGTASLLTSAFWALLARTYNARRSAPPGLLELDVASLGNRAACCMCKEPQRRHVSTRPLGL